jgi:hypothetical protein
MFKFVEMDNFLKVKPARASTTKLFMVVNYSALQLVRVFAIVRHFHPCLIFVGKARSLPRALTLRVVPSLTIVIWWSRNSSMVNL